MSADRNGNCDRVSNRTTSLMSADRNCDRTSRRHDSRDRRDKSRDRYKDRSRERSKTKHRRRHDRSRSRDSHRRRRERKSKWDSSDEASFNPMQFQMIQMQQQQMLAMQAQVCNKKQRELYVGNLSIGLVTADTLKEFFNGLFNVLPDFKAKYATLGTPVVHVQLSGDGKYAFVELRDDTLAATCIRFNKTELCGRALNIGRPAGYNPNIPVPDPLDITPLTSAGIVPAVGAAALANKKQREVYVGNLPIGMVTPQMLKELFTKPMTMLPEYDPALGPPVLNVDLGPEGRYAFVEFQSEKLGTAALNTFQNLQLYGRALTLGRPSGYIPGEASGTNFQIYAPGASAPMAYINPQGVTSYPSGDSGAFTAPPLEHQFSCPVAPPRDRSPGNGVC